MMECIHHWKYGLKHYEGREAKTHMRCLKCRAERYLIENLDTGGKRNTELWYPEKEKEGEMAAKFEEKWKYWEGHKAEIIEDLQIISHNEVREKWGIPSSEFLTRIKKKWGLTIFAKGDARKCLRVELVNKETSPPNHIPASNIPAGNTDIPLEIVEHLVSYEIPEATDAFWLGYLVGRGLKALDGQGKTGTK